MTIVLIAVTTSLALIGLGGGIYEFIVIDSIWPGRPHIQPEVGGAWRRRFWMSVHTSFELLLIASLVAAWPRPEIRFWLLIALASHAGMRIWSAVYFIPKTLRPVRAILLMKLLEVTREARGSEQASMESAARTRTRRGLLRLPLDIATCVAMLAALVIAAR